MKKKILFTALFFLCAAGGFAQKKLFQDAMEAGRQPNKFYVIQNDKNKKVDIKDLMKYANENNIVLGKETYKTISRFGDNDMSIESIEFLPKSEYPAYVFANIHPELALPSSAIPQPCPIFIFMGFSDEARPLQQQQDFKWYGNVENGLAQGNGMGYTINNNSLIFTIGNYVNGFPEGKVETVVYNLTDGYKPFFEDKLTKYEVVIGRMGEDRASILKDSLMGFVEKTGAMVIQPKYKKIVKDFENGKAVVVYDEREIIINKAGEFVDYSDRQKQLYAQAADIRQQAINMAEGNGVTRNLVQSVELFRKAAELGDAEAQFRLARCYDGSGEGVDADAAQAVKWFEKAAKEGNAKAIRNLGLCFEYGKGVAKDMAKAEELYRKAFPGISKLAQQGDAEGQFYLGHCYSNGQGVQKDLAQAVEWYRKAAEQGNARAQAMLGDCYYNGEGVTKDLTQAVEWYRKAAEQGYSYAMTSLGYRYDMGEGVEKDPAQAVIWYRRAAEQGESIAQANLGTMYEYGRGVEKDPSQALAWYRKSAAQGESSGQRKLGYCYYYGNCGVEKNYNEAFSLFSKSAEQGDEYAQDMLGDCYYNGNGVTKDLAKAVEWYRKAAEQGESDAQYSLGYCYYHGEGVTQDYAKAVEWYRKAADQGNSAAMNSIGYSYEVGEGLPQDMAKAVEWYRKAAEKGNEVAMSNMGNCYQYGKGVTKNMQRAIEWYEKAAAQGNERAANALQDIKDENAKKAKLAQFTRRLGYNPDGTTIQQLVKVGRSISAVIDYINNYYVRGYDYFINLSSDSGGSYKSYRLSRTTSKSSDGTRYGKTVANISVSGDKITYVYWSNGY